MNNDTLTPALIALGEKRLSTHFGFANLAQLLKDYLFTFGRVGSVVAQAEPLTRAGFGDFHPPALP